MVQSSVVYPGTFDPITLGHENIIHRAATLFAHVTIAVAKGIHKKTYFSLNDRVDMIHLVTSELPNVSVVGFSGLLLDLLDKLKTPVVVRGLRSSADFAYEYQLAGMNKRMNPDIQTVFLTADDQYQFISSSMVREVASLRGDIAGCVNPELVKKIQQRLITPSDVRDRDIEESTWLSR